MDIAVSLWRCKWDPDYRRTVNDLADFFTRQQQAEALRLLERCEGLDPSDVFDEIEKHPPSSYVIAALIELAKTRQRTRTASGGATARHAEHRAMKNDVFIWLDANMSKFKSLDAATTEIASKVVPIKWRTARDWVGEWKKVRSAGTP